MSYGWAAAAQAGSDLLGSLGNAWIQADQNKKQREWTERREDLSYQRGWDVMNYQNWYNSPEQQMTRFRQAGLNPHLIYGKGTPGNTATSSPTSTPGRPKFGLTPIGVGNWLQNLNAAKLTVENVKKLQEEQAYINRQTQYTKQKQANAFLKSQEMRWNILSKMNMALQSKEYFKGQAKYMSQKAINEGIRSGVLETNQAVNVARKALIEKQTEFQKYSGNWLNMIFKIFDEMSPGRLPDEMRDARD